MCSLLDRNKCFEIVASVVKEAVPDSSVDLKSPEARVFSPINRCQKIYIFVFLSYFYHVLTNHIYLSAFRSC